MRLNLWQRLGIVLSVLALLIAPVAIWISASNSLYESQLKRFNECLELTGSGTYPQRDTCVKDFLNRTEIDFWPYWQEVFFGVAGGLIIIWVLAYIATYTVKWVLAGKNVE